MTPAAVRYQPAGSPSAMIEQFARDPVRVGKAMRDALNEDAGGFAEAVARAPNPSAADRGFRYALILLRDSGLLVPMLASPATTSFAQALKIVRVAIESDRNFANSMLDALVGRSELQSGESVLRILDLVAQCPEHVSSWRRVSRLSDHGDSRVRSKCSSLLARFNFHERRVVTSFEEAEPRERANLLEALWDANPARTAGVVEQALTDSNNRVAGNACLALYRAGNPRALSSLADMLHGEAREFRVTAAWVMGQLRDRRFAGLLRKAAGSDDLVLRRTAIRALTHLDRTVNCGIAEGVQAVFVSAPAGPAGDEIWISVQDADGRFIKGMAAVDFYLSDGEENPVLDYSVEEVAVTGGVSLRVCWPAANRECREAAASGLSASPPGWEWAVEAYDPLAVQTGEASVKSGFAIEPEAINARLNCAEWSSRNAAESCGNLLALVSSARQQHLIVLVDEENAGNGEMEAVRNQAAMRGIRLHTWLLAGAGDVAALNSQWSRFAAALTAGYVMRVAGIQPDRLAIRQTGEGSPKFSPEIALPRGAVVGRADGGSTA